LSTKTYIPPPAFELAKEWCERNPNWKRICDIEDSDSLALSWNELPKRDRDRWERDYPRSGEDMWLEFATNRPNRHRFGHIGDDGQFYSRVYDFPRGKPFNSMMVFEVGGKAGVYYRGGMKERSSTADIPTAGEGSK
jgi:hypothetical protein